MSYHVVIESSAKTSSDIFEDLNKIPSKTPVELSSSDYRKGAIQIQGLDSQSSQLKSSFSASSTSVSSGILHLFRDTKAAITTIQQTSNILAFMAIPKSMSTQDFIGFLGNYSTLVSHIRLVHDSFPNRYLALLKTTNNDDAKTLFDAFNTRKFDAEKSETCNVVFVGSIKFSTNETLFPSEQDSSIVEIPSCPVCLDRMVCLSLL